MNTMRIRARKVTAGIVYALLCFVCMSRAAYKADDLTQTKQTPIQMSHVGMFPKSSQTAKSEAFAKSIAAKDAADQYCFQFTWPGTGFDNATDLCKDAKKSQNPCFLPYVISNETNAVPDIDALDIYCDGGNNCNVYCKLANGKNCIRYAYYRDGYLFNATYFCGLVNESSNDDPRSVPLKSGCNSQNTGSFKIEACYCQTNKCNKYQN